MIDFCESSRSYDPTRERTHRQMMRLQMMRLLYQAGNRIAALQHYAYCCSVLKTQLDVQAEELYTRIKAGQGLIRFSPASPPSARAGSLGVAGRPLPRRP